jgi:hypothetical protein
MKFLRSQLAPLYIVGLATGAFVALTGCKKEEPPPPLPAAQPTASQAVLELKAADAGVEEIDSGAPKKTGGRGGGGGPLTACCKALAQNANLAPEPTKTYMMQAAAMCNSAAAAGQGMGSVVGMLSGALRGAAMPAACK